MLYSEIINLALREADRNDAEVIDRMDDFIRMVEARLNRALKTTNQSIRTITETVAGQEYYALPADFSGMRDIEIRDTLSSTDRKQVLYVSPEQLNRYANNTGSNYYYTIVAGQIQLLPTTSGKVLEIIYYATIPELTETNTSNWVSLRFPDVYLYGLMVEISAFVKDPTTAALWDTRFKEALNEISTDDQLSRWSGPSLVIRTEYV